MAVRNIISIDEELCNGCGNCVTGCAEGAIQLIEGKARLVKEEFCDGFGDCIGECPTGALKIVKKESKEFDIESTRQHLMKTGGPEAVKKMEDANRKHAVRTKGAACPGTMAMKNLNRGGQKAAVTTADLPPKVYESELSQWPIQLHLVNPESPFFRNRELVVLSTCSPVASADANWRFVRERSVAVACPKLDRTDGYEEKLAAILSEASIPAVTIVRMEVPCCGGLTRIVKNAARSSGRTDLSLSEVTIGLDGSVMKEDILQGWR